jgi:hypothetical protein
MKTPDDISAARIIALGLAGPAVGGPADVVRHLVCIQAQALPGSLIAVALRTADRDPTAVAAALADGSVVRSWTQRGTIHLVPAADLGWILGLTADRMLQSTSRRKNELGIDGEMFDRATDIVTELIRARGPVTRAALVTALQPLGISDVPGREYHLITMLAMRQVIAQGPLVNGGRTEQLFVLNEDWIAAPRTVPRVEAVAEWMTRYAIGHGPVTAADAARWTGLPLSDARAGLAAGLDVGALASTEIDGAIYLHAPDLPDRLAEHRAEADDMHLLPGFDELIIGYKDRTPTITAADERLVVPGGNGVFRATVVHRSRAVGTWTRSPRASGPLVLLTPFPGRRINQRLAERAARRHPAFLRHIGGDMGGPAASPGMPVGTGTPST